MARYRMLFRALLTSFALAAASASASAVETIRSFELDLQVAANGEITVAETITVNVEGRDIRRGIFRDFPLTMEDKEGQTVQVGFDVVSVTREGEPEAWHTEPISGGSRIYMGSNDKFLEHGEHTYVITYRTDRQIRYFADHDELFWNVTGNGWMFRIDHASARVTLPGGARVTSIAAFTGPFGATGTNATMRSDGNVASFSTNQPLQPNEGMTVVVGISKGSVQPRQVEKPPMNPEILGMFFRLYSAAEHCEKRGQTFTAEALSSLTAELQTMALQSGLPKSERDRIWSIVQEDFAVQRQGMGPNECHRVKIVLTSLVPKAFEPERQESPF